VLALDARVAGEVARLRRALLAQIGAREFGADAAFADPCDSFVLPDVICGSCRACRALDLCRDAQQRPGDADDAAAASSRHWACEQCAQPYARAAIEQQLVELVQRRATRYQLQDVRCVRCHRVATRLMAGACQCGGKLALDTPPGEFLAEMRTLGRIAHAHELPLLAAQIEHVTH
jgi:DNA polymerase epsilon subunit 1